MARVEAFRHEFVEHIPDRLEPAVLYISLCYATIVHLCACGCGIEVVTPLNPRAWAMTFDGKTVSLSPSIGNWSFPCQSHYWIESGRVRWAARWSREHIDRVRAMRSSTVARSKEIDDSVDRPPDGKGHHWQA